MRAFLAGIAVCGALLGACSRHEGEGVAAGASDQPGVNGLVRAQVNPHSPYAGKWASDSDNCGNEKKIWTIEPRRMGIRPALRFCAFRTIAAAQDASSEDSVWSANADCLAEGHETREVVFFRLKQNLREMRVTFNDNRPTDLVRCLAPSSS